MQAIYQINVGGVNVSDNINPLLEQLSVEGKSGAAADSADLVLADVDGEILMPSKSDPIEISLGWNTTGLTLVFTGSVEKVRSQGGRGKGRTLHIMAKSFDTSGKAKEHLEFHKDDASLSDFMREAAGKAGLSFQAHPDLASLQRPYWVAARESFLQLGTRLGRELGAGFKIIGSTAYMWPRNTPLFGAGDTGGAITATWGDNLLDWDIAPDESRPRFGQARACWYDQAAAKWMDTLQAIGLPGASAVFSHGFIRTDSDEATHVSTSNQRESERNAGSGTVTLLGEPAAQDDGICNIVGARPGIDGAYRIDTYAHSLDRDGGFVTRLTLKQPQGSAGTDSRADDGGGSSDSSGGAEVSPGEPGSGNAAP